MLCMRSSGYRYSSFLSKRFDHASFSSFLPAPGDVFIDPVCVAVLRRNKASKYATQHRSKAFHIEPRTAIYQRPRSRSTLGYVDSLGRKPSAEPGRLSSVAFYKRLPKLVTELKPTLVALILSESVFSEFGEYLGNQGQFNLR